MAATASVSLRIAEGTAVAGEARSHALLVDRPQEKGGGDRGPMGGELLLLGLGGCFLSTFIAALHAEAPEFATGGIAVTVTGEVESAPPRFARIRVVVDAPQALAERLRKPFVKAERGCIVHNTLKGGADVQFEYRWRPAADAP
jgi:putative redox protein